MKSCVGAEMLTVVVCLPGMPKALDLIASLKKNY